ncbi:MAG: oligoendopeptidase [Solirubrobacteraceae bacterium]|jgi:oligoendopeptidase F|nr:oligoendopeptidase [Solirubrobacteraceae bacterium]
MMSVQDVSWDLSPLVHGENDAGADRLLGEATARAQTFAEHHAGRVAELDAPTFAAAVRELQEISELASRAGNYAMLRFSIDTADPALGALLQRVQEKSTAIETQLLFFELEWAALEDERADELLAADGLDTARHFLRSARRYRPHLLSEPEEKILTEKTVSGRSAWSRLFSEQVSALSVSLPGQEEPVTLDGALARLMSSDRDVRRGAADAVTDALAPGLRTRAFIFNTLLHDKAVDDRLRKYPNWLADRNLANEASDESVQALLAAVRNRYELPRRWYRLKAQLLGIDRLADYDRMAAVTRDEDDPVEWDDAKELVLDSYASFTPELGDPARAFFVDRRIDAPPRPAKRGGAFAAYTVPSEHPYLMLNYTAKRRDVLVLAHEMGHGLHAELARPRGVLEQHTPLTLAETASVFGETLVFRRLLDKATTPESRLSLLAESIEGSIATVFRQTAMNRFEELVHTSRRKEGELAVDRFNELWTQSQEEMLGDSVQLTPGYRTWWSYVPHFISTPGYVYAYAYGQLLALSIYKRYVDEGESFVPSYLELLRAGGSKSPQELGRIVGIDLADPGFWDSGLALVEAQLEEAETAANEALTRA